MNPIEAGFDGAKGINMGVPGIVNGGIYRLTRGKSSPVGNVAIRRNMLLWYNPEGEDPMLLFLNPDGQWFEVSFNPVNLK